MSKPTLEWREDALHVSGALAIGQTDALDLPDGTTARRIILGELTRFDTAGAWRILDLATRWNATIEGATPAQASLLETVRHNLPAAAEPTRDIGLRDRIAGLGHLVWDAFRDVAGLTAFLGRFMAELAQLLRHPSRLRGTSLAHHMQAAGFDAFPIVALMAFLIGIVVAFQGASQLQRFGAEIFVVDLIAISVLRELGILLTAIIVAGRSASAFTAAIGSMKMREEVDALRALGLDPMTILVTPRILALVLTLPILTILANGAGLTGGALMAWLDLGITPGAFANRVAEGIGPWHLAVGLIKAPVFAVIIGIVGCRNGLNVGGDAESLGRLTSSSVVAAIFLVILADAVFSVFFALMGI